MENLLNEIVEEVIKRVKKEAYIEVAFFQKLC